MRKTEISDLSRARPERSKKRVLTTKGNIASLYRLTPHIKAEIAKEAAKLEISESLYVNIILQNRNRELLQKKIKKIKK